MVKKKFTRKKEAPHPNNELYDTIMLYKEAKKAGHVDNLTVINKKTGEIIPDNEYKSIFELIETVKELKIKFIPMMRTHFKEVNVLTNAHELNILDGVEKIDLCFMDELPVEQILSIYKEGPIDRLLQSFVYRKNKDVVACMQLRVNKQMIDRFKTNSSRECNICFDNKYKLMFCSNCSYDMCVNCYLQIKVCPICQLENKDAYEFFKSKHMNFFEYIKT